ncbi:MAG: SIS domain-containing protein [Chlorobi bacterium]|nr:SIS domain-containing protein [Chlorobiota bacterium]
MNFSDYKDYTNKAINSVIEEEVQQFIETLYEAYKRGSTIYVIGNGGSAANASHFAQDLAKGTRANVNQIKCIRALSLTDNFAFFSALGNDEGYDSVFVQQLRTFAKQDDVLVAISGSGNSKNVIKAVEYANSHGIKTIGVTGFNGGELINIVNEKVHVPLNDMCTAESVHTVVFHYVILNLLEKMKEEFSLENS